MCVVLWLQLADWKLGGNAKSHSAESFLLKQKAHYHIKRMAKI